MFSEISWFLFCFKYRLGLAVYGVDFFDSGDPCFDPDCQ